MFSFFQKTIESPILLDSLSPLTPPEALSPSLHTSNEEDSTLARFVEGLAFPVDDFQYEALEHIAAGESVVVCAPTGSGKTLIAEFAALRTLEKGQKLFYTTPLKALSNQKYYDLKQQFGEQNVGLLTGDMSSNRDARIVVMTTEVFRNMLYGLNEDRGLLDNLGAVVLDECHFMNDADRGTVWEECIVYCPQHVQMLALSATVANAQELTNWMNHIHPPCHLVWSDFRPVPLQFHYFKGERLSPLFEQGNSKTLNKHLANIRPQPKGSRTPRGGGSAFNPIFLMEALQERQMLPAIVFTFSRKGCEQGMRQCGEFPMTTPEERERLTNIIDTFCAQTQMPLDDTTRHALINGVAAHHAGLLPGLKLLVETLFQQNLLKAVFATETLAAGINMPARTTVISSISKRSDDGHRTLKASEFLQMSGRAGRRGLDDQGHVVIVHSLFHPPLDVAKLASAPADALNSQFTPTFGMVLNLLQKLNLGAAEQLCSRSFGSYTADRRTKPLRSELDSRSDLLQQAIDFPCPAGLDLEAFREHLDDRARMSFLRRQEGRLRRDVKKFGDQQPKLKATLEALEEDIGMLAMRLDDSPCGPCPEFKAHRRLEEKTERLQKQVARLEDQVQEERNTYWLRFMQLYNLLQELGYIELNEKPSPFGQLVSQLRTENEVFVAEMIRTQLLEELTPEQLGAVLSAVVNDSSREPHGVLYPSKGVQHTMRQLFKLSQKVDKLQRKHLIVQPIHMNVSCCALVEAWAKGCSWQTLKDMTTLDQGDLVRNLRRVCDVLRQLAHIPGMPTELSQTARLALDAIHRDPVKEVDWSEEDRAALA